MAEMKNLTINNKTYEVVDQFARDQLSDKAPMYAYGTEDLIAGQSNLATGALYFVYDS